MEETFEEEEIEDTFEEEEIEDSLEEEPEDEFILKGICLWMIVRSRLLSNEPA